MNSSLTSRFGFSSTASHEHASEEAKVCDQSEQVEAADQTKESGLNKESEAFAEKLFDTLARQRDMATGQGGNGYCLPNRPDPDSPSMSPYPILNGLKFIGYPRPRPVVLVLGLGQGVGMSSPLFSWELSPFD
ncbi:hypothetical protein D0Y65_052958 [Glycine soja]|uniref:Uncharacterized protein n=1 Tax=Glycine soja TaxID=3848 RepID=A0A445F075_GLYSO|nr:hypothetical protein D0Y65_052958 [Glycine soja]